MSRRKKGSRNYNYSRKTGSEDGLRADKRRTRIFVVAMFVVAGVVIALLGYLWMIK